MQTLILERPLDVELNAAILDIVTRVPPGGYEVAENGPRTWLELKAHLDLGKKLVVHSGGSKDTIYGDPTVNYAFRAWHDYVHWSNNCDFSVEGERDVCDEQCRVLAVLAKTEQQAARWCSIIDAEVMGQKFYHRLHGRFPRDQRGFVLAYLHHPTKALAGHR